MTREEVTKFWTDVVEVVLRECVSVREEFEERINDAENKTAEEQNDVFCDVVDAVVKNIVSRISDEDLAKMGEV